MDCKIKAQDREGKCVTGEQCADIKCTGQGAEYIPPTVAEVELPDYGVINFGYYQGKEWIKLPSNYLLYLMGDDCHTAQSNKDKAKKCLELKKVLKGQLELKALRGEK